MRMKILAALSAALMVTAAPLANAAELIVYHGWSTNAEVAALNVLGYRLAMLTSRFNTMLSIPMLYFMVAQQNGGL